MTDHTESFLPLPHLSHLVLLALAEGDAHGWEIIRRIREIEPSAKTPSSGSLYTAMVRLGDAGLLEESAPPAGVEVDARRRYYRLTTLGVRVLEAETRRLAQLVERGRRRLSQALPVRGKA